MTFLTFHCSSSSIQIFHVWFSFQRLIWRIDQGQVLIVYYYKCDSLLFQISACLSSACDKLREKEVLLWESKSSKVERTDDSV